VTALNTEAFHPYDTEIIEMQRIKDEVNNRASLRGGSVDRDAMGRELKDRMYTEAGLVVNVLWYTVGEQMPDGSIREIVGRFDPEVVPVGRVNKQGVDHDQMKHEIVNDVLGLGEGGLIKVTTGDVRAALEHAKGHSH
jgi:hypothetical protein